MREVDEHDDFEEIHDLLERSQIFDETDDEHIYRIYHDICIAIRDDEVDEVYTIVATIISQKNECDDLDDENEVAVVNQQHHEQQAEADDEDDDIHEDVADAADINE